MTTTGSDESLEDTDRVWRAMANPTRRALMDHMRAGPRTTGELAEVLPDLSRYAVMQHLDVLVKAGLVVARREGRRRYNHLNAVPLRRLYERWVHHWADVAARESLAIGRLADETAADSKESADMSALDRDVFRVVRIENELDFAAPPERVFDVIANRTREWFPATYGGERTQAVVLEPWPGGRTYEDWGAGAGYLYGHVTLWDPPHALSIRTRLGPGTTMDTAYSVAPTEAGGRLTMSRLVAGPISDEEAAGIREHGDLARFEEALRRVIERDTT